MPRSLFDKIWSQHDVLSRPDAGTLLYIDRHLIHEGSRRGFDILRDKGLSVRRPDLTFATADHYVPTRAHATQGVPDADKRGIVEALEGNTKAAGVQLFGIGHRQQGIVHVIGPELGLTLPGTTVVCGDSHTATHGALGALAFGIGASEVAHVLATQTLWQHKPKAMRITISGRLRPGTSAKDIILAIIARIGMSGASGYVVEYAGPVVDRLSIEQRLTLCNMSIEAGAKFGLIAPDDTTIAYLAGRPFAPTGDDWDRYVARWRKLASDPDAVFDRDLAIDISDLRPMITWGTSPEDAIQVDGCVPDPDHVDAKARDRARAALDYMGLSAGMRVTDIAFDRVFIGSCTNGRISDLREAARVIDGRKAILPALVVPGSTEVKTQAEAEGLDRIFTSAGFEWRSSGCSMCVGMNGDLATSGERCASTSNRNFVGRQGVGVRTHLMSPAMAAAIAVFGKPVDVSQIVDGDR
ncbi:3-isopropylmalate dehydratase large subunit [Bradyrhizobium sp. AS23.2]|uniref:3-isopropylmalate dehydratase large subunit n=1 Tax=Bradyrhizobium sp. AS23.2 TaxID=1680155 RepID=UPI00093D505B|nr:3-isopropylmalate dehydratase large subunit [Bradyrhizobium sp. AS23.2]OKO81088.1 isopropylmalate isomerase [Bradyrhizobium sp. AS23.2]